MAGPEATTREGVSRNDPPRVETKPMTDATNPRRQNVADIVQAHRDKIQADLDEQANPHNQPPPEGETPPAEPAAAQPVAQPSPQPAAAPPVTGEQKAMVDRQAAPAPASPEPPKEPMVTVMIEGKATLVPASALQIPTRVDGTDEMISGADVIAGFQKVKSGDRRLYEGTQRLQAAEQKERELAAREAALVGSQPASPTAPAPASSPAGQPMVQPTAPQPSAPPAAAPAPQGDDKTPAITIEDVTRELQYGEESVAGQKLEQYIAQKVNEGRGNGAATPQPPIDPTQIVTQAVDVMDRKRRYDDELNQFGREYAAIVKEPMLRTQAAVETHNLRAEQLAELGHDVTRMSQGDIAQMYWYEQQRNLVGSDLDLYRAAGDRVAERARAMGMTLEVGPQTAPAADPPTTPQPGPSAVATDDFAAKEQRKQQGATPPQAATAFVQGEPEAKPKTPSEVVNDIRRARGQPVAA